MANDQVTSSPPSTITAGKLNDITVGTTAPTSPTLGWTWVDTSGSTPIAKIWDGSTWSTTSTYAGLGDSTIRMIPTATSVPHRVAGAAWNPAGTILAVIDASNNQVYAIPYNAATGFGPSVTSANPGAGPVDVAWSPDGNYVGVAISGTPFVKVFPWTGTAFSAAVANPSPLPAGTNGNSVAWNPAGTFIAVGSNGTPFIQIYAWSAGFGTKSTNPVSVPTNVPVRLAWAPSGLSLSLVMQVSPYLEGYPVNASGVFGTKFSNPVTLPAGQAHSLAINAAGDLIAVGHVTSPYVSVYPYSDSTGFGTKLTNPTEVPTNTANVVRWHEATVAGVAVKQLIVGTTSSSLPNLIAYGFSGGVFSNQNRALLQQITQMYTAVAALPVTFWPIIQIEDGNGPSIAINPVNRHVAIVATVQSGGSSIANNNMFILVPNSG